MSSVPQHIQEKNFQLRKLNAAVWDLKHTEDQPPEESHPVKHHDAPSTESIRGVDERVLVPAADYAEGGKYYSIVKIFAQYEFSGEAWSMGTGWLIKPDLIVTAGHMVFNYAGKAGRATAIKAYVGYSGKESIRNPGVQFRKGARCVTTANWLSQKDAKASDVSWIKLEKPFANIRPIEYMSTPESGTSILGVVGYPGDYEYEGEKGAQMYEMFTKEKYNLAEEKSGMLEYSIDTFGGNSGSPVFLKTPSSMKAAGVHVWSGTRGFASVIGPKGNPFEDYLSVMDAKIPADGALHILPTSQAKGVI